MHGSIAYPQLRSCSPTLPISRLMLVRGVGATFDDIHRQRALKVRPVAGIFRQPHDYAIFWRLDWSRIRVFVCGGIFAAGADD